MCKVFYMFLRGLAQSKKPPLSYEWRFALLSVRYLVSFILPLESLSFIFDRHIDRNKPRPLFIGLVLELFCIPGTRSS